MSMNLYEIRQEHFALLLELQNGEGELSPQLEARLTAIEAAHDDKIEACCAVIKNMKGIIDLHAVEIRRLKERKDAIEARMERLKDWLGGSIGPEGWQRGVHKLSWRKSSKVVIVNEEAVPLEHLRTKYEPDKESIEEAIKCGAELPYARIEEKNNLQVK